MTRKNKTRPARAFSRFRWPALLVISALLAVITEPRTTLTLAYDGKTLVASSNGARRALEITLPAAQHVYVQTKRSRWRWKLDGWRVQRTGQPDLSGGSVPLNRAGGPAPLDDIFLDSGLETATTLLPVPPLDGPFVLELDIRGRATLPQVVGLTGDPARQTPTVFCEAAYGVVDQRLRLSSPSHSGEDLFYTLPVQKSFVWLLHDLSEALLAAAALLCALSLGAALLDRLPRPKRRKKSAREIALPRWWPLPVAALGLGAMLWIHYGVLEGVCHYPDEIMYFVQAEWLTKGHLTMPVTDLGPYFRTPWMQSDSHRYYSIHPLGWSLLLAVARWLGLRDILAALFGAGYLYLLIVTARDWYGERVAAITAGLAALSPFLLLLFASPMPHAACAFFVLLAIRHYPLELHPRNRRGFFLSSLFLGAAFCCRPVVAVFIGVAFLLTAFTRRAKFPAPKQTAVLLAIAVLGFVATAWPVFVQNYLITGNPLIFGGGKSITSPVAGSAWPGGFQNLGLLLHSLTYRLFGWGCLAGLTLAFPLLGALYGPRGRREGLLIAVFLSVIGGFVAFVANGLDLFGPRYYSEALACYFLLAALGLDRLAVFFAQRVRAAAWKLWAERLPYALMILALVGQLARLPSYLRRYRGYYYVTGDFAREVEKNAGDKYLVLLPDGSIYTWMQIGQLLDGTLAGRHLFASDQNLDSALLPRRFTDRPIYRWDGGQLKLVQKASP